MGNRYGWDYSIDHRNAMSEAASRRVLVSDRRVLILETRAVAFGNRLELILEVDGHGRHALTTPGWREVSTGQFQDIVYLWSARDLIVLRPDEAAPRRLRFDEDLLFVFGTHDGWVLVCETSVRKLVNDIEVARVEFGEIIGSATWVGPLLQLRSESGGVTNIRVGGYNLDLH